MHDETVRGGANLGIVGSECHSRGQIGACIVIGWIDQRSAGQPLAAELQINAELVGARAQGSALCLLERRGVACLGFGQKLIAFFGRGHGIGVLAVLRRRIDRGGGGAVGRCRRMQYGPGDRAGRQGGPGQGH